MNSILVGEEDFAGRFNREVLVQLEVSLLIVVERVALLEGDEGSGEIVLGEQGRLAEFLVEEVTLEERGRNVAVGKLVQKEIFLVFGELSSELEVDYHAPNYYYIPEQ